MFSQWLTETNCYANFFTYYTFCVPYYFTFSVRIIREAITAAKLHPALV